VPALLSPPSISGVATEGRTLTAGTGSWTNSPTGYAYLWERCDGSGGGCSSIPGATHQSYLLSAGDVGHRLRVIVTASNAGGLGVPAASAVTALTGPSAARVRAALSSLLAVNGTSARRLLRSNGYAASFTAPSAGTL